MGFLGVRFEAGVEGVGRGEGGKITQNQAYGLLQIGQESEK